MKIKTIIAMVIMIIAIVFATVFGLVVWFDNLVGINQEITKNNEPIEINGFNTFIPIEMLITTASPISTLVTAPTLPETTQTIEPIITTKPSTKFASLTISTNKRTKTYEIMPDVVEKTLKKNIGWLPGSALPGSEGLCVLMGHRDTDFSILKNVVVDDIITAFTKDKEYTYQVTRIEIIDSDSALKFNVQEGSKLVLVTCYPFRYSGHAPKKYMVYSRILLS